MTMPAMPEPELVRLGPIAAAVMEAAPKIDPPERIEREPAEEENPAEIEEMSLTGAPLTWNSANKPWMDYRAVTDTTSTQWALISQACHRGDGLLELDGCILVALGSYWGPVGTTYRATIGGRTVYLLKADAKQDAHTEGGLGVAGMNGHLIEAIVDTDYLEDAALIMGDCDYIEALNGAVTELEVLG